MKNYIFVFSREKFTNFVKTLTEKQISESAFISIHEPKNKIIGGYVEAWPTILPESDNVLNLWFNDVEEDCPDVESVLFDEIMAQKVFDFVQNNSDKRAWFLHCTAGICRSGAVGDVLADYFEIPYQEFKYHNSQIRPNSLVRKELRKVFFENHPMGLI